MDDVTVDGPARSGSRCSRIRAAALRAWGRPVAQSPTTITVALSPMPTSGGDVSEGVLIVQMGDTIWASLGSIKRMSQGPNRAEAAAQLLGPAPDVPATGDRGGEMTVTAPLISDSMQVVITDMNWLTAGLRDR